MTVLIKSQWWYLFLVCSASYPNLPELQVPTWWILYSFAYNFLSQVGKHIICMHHTSFISEHLILLPLPTPPLITCWNTFNPLLFQFHLSFMDQLTSSPLIRFASAVSLHKIINLYKIDIINKDLLRGFYSTLNDNLYGKRLWERIDICICVTKS